MTMLCGVSCHHPCRQLRERDGVPSSVSSSVVGDGRHHRDGDDGWIESNRIEPNQIKSNQINCGKWMVTWYGMTWHA